MLSTTAITNTTFKTPGGPCGTIPRKTAYGASPVAAQVPLDVIPYEAWPDLIADQERHKSSLLHIWEDCGMGALMQFSLNYCWLFASVGGLMLQRAAQGLPFEMLSPSSLAWIVNYENKGWYIEDALKGLISTGAATREFVPMATNNPRDFKRGWKESAAQHKVTIAKDIPANHQIQGSQLLLNRPMPTGHNDWRHAVLHLAVKDINPRLPCDNINRYAVPFLNSWDKTWGDNGIGEFRGSRQVADQAYVLEQGT